jgi:hypothetical protein
MVPVKDCFANGLEPQQVSPKGMGAAFMDQIVNNYLSKTN